MTSFSFCILSETTLFATIGECLILLRIATLAIPVVTQSHFVTREIFSVWLELIQYIIWNIFSMIGFNSVQKQFKDTSIRNLTLLLWQTSIDWSLLLWIFYVVVQKYSLGWDWDGVYNLMRLDDPIRNHYLNLKCKLLSQFRLTDQIQRSWDDFNAADPPSPVRVLSVPEPGQWRTVHCWRIVQDLSPWPDLQSHPGRGWALRVYGLPSPSAGLPPYGVRGQPGVDQHRVPPPLWRGRLVRSIQQVLQVVPQVILSSRD